MASIAARLKKFLASPANQTGLIVGGSTIAGLAVQYADHNLAVSMLAAGVVGTVAKIVQPDNIALSTDAEKLVTDGLTLIATKNPALLTSILADAAKVSGDLAPTSTAKAS